MDIKRLNEEVLNQLDIRESEDGQIRYRMVVRGDYWNLVGFRRFMENPDYGLFSNTSEARCVFNSRFVDTPETVAFQWTSPGIYHLFSELAALWPNLTFLVEAAIFGNDRCLEELEVQLSYQDRSEVALLPIEPNMCRDDFDLFWTDARSCLMIELVGADNPIFAAFAWDVLGAGIPLVNSTYIE